MTTGGATLVVERELHIEARPEIVFRFLTERDYLLRWQSVDAALDLRPEGEYRIHLNGGDTVTGRFIEVIPPSRLVYTWGWETGGVPGVGPGSSRVDITLTPDGAGTRLRLVHSGLPSDRDVVSSRGDGWSYYLMRLADVVAGRMPPEDGHAAGMDVITGASALFDSRFGNSASS